MHAPKHVQGALLGAALAASLTIAPAAHAAAGPPDQKLGYVVSFKENVHCEEAGKRGQDKGFWGTFSCAPQGEDWHLLLKLDELKRRS